MSPRAPRWPWLVAVAALASGLVGAAWCSSQRHREIAGLRSRLGLRVGSVEGTPWPRRLSDVALDLSPNVRVSAARVELGFFPWQRAKKAYGVVVRAQGPLDAVWEEARKSEVAADFEVMDARLEYTAPSGGRLTADGLWLEPGPRDHLQVRSLHAFGATFRDVHVWASQPSTALQLRLGREPQDAKAPTLNVSRSPGEGAEWTLDLPSQPFSMWSGRLGLNVDDTWSNAVIVGVGSWVVPDAPTRSARADFRFTVDNWHRPSWPEAGVLTGRSGALAFRVSPAPDGTLRLTRVEVAAGLFTLLGSGQLSLGEPSRLTFEARGELSCASLLAHLPASRHREHVQAYLREHPSEAAREEKARLELSVRAEAPRGAPLQFRFHLHPGCGLPEMKEG